MQSTTSFVCVFMESERVEGRSRRRRQEAGAGGRGRRQEAESVKLQRPAPEIAIFLPVRSACSSTTTLRPRFPASIAQKRPAAPPPITTTSVFCTLKRFTKRRHKKGQRTPGFAALSLLDLACKPVLTVGLRA